jgi:hypothetical protein
LPGSVISATIVVMRKSTYYALATLCSAIVVSFSATAVTFEVTTAEEFQAALVTAARNEGNDEILLAKGIYRGSFKYLANDDSALLIKAIAQEEVVIDASGGGFGLMLLTGDYESSLSIENLTIRGIGDDSGAGAAILIDGNASEVNISRLEFRNTAEAAAIRATDLASLRLEELVAIENDPTSGAQIALELVEKTTMNQLSGFSLTIKGRPNDFSSLEINGSSLRNISLDGLSRFKIKDSTIFQQSGRLLQALSSATNYDISGNKFIFEDCGDVRVIVYPPSSWELRTFNVDRNVFKSAQNCSAIGVDYLGYRTDFGGTVVWNISNNLFDGVSLRTNKVYKSRTEFLIRGNTFAYLGTPVELGADIYSEVRLINNIFYSPSLKKQFIQQAPFSRAELLNNVILDSDGFWDLAAENIAADPKFYDPESGDYHLAADSPAIDSGTNTTLSDADLDLDGNSRVLNGTVDIGAYERSTAALHPADTNGDSSISREEFDAYNNAWRANEMWPNPPASIEADYVTRAGYLLQKGGAYKNIGVGKPVTWVPLNE